MSSQKKGKTRHQPAAPSVQRDKVQRDLLRRNVAEDHIAAIMSMMDPSLATANSQIPARGAWMRSSTVESTVLKLSAADGSINAANGRFDVEARARPDGTLTTRSSATDAEDAETVEFQLLAAKAINSATAASFDGVILAHRALGRPQELGTIAAGGSKQVVTCISTAGGSRTLLISNSTLACRLVVTPFTGPLGALVAGVTHNVPVGIDSGGPVTIVFPAATTYVAFEYSYVAGSDAGRKLSIAGNFAPTAAGALLAITPATLTRSLTTLAGIEKLRAFRIAAQSLLLTYTGSMINNGGEIAIARVPATWSPDPGKTVYESILLLPRSRRYAGKVAKGAHCFWVPETVEDFDPKLYGIGYSLSEKPAYKIVAAGALDDPTESIMLQLETIVEFQTDAPSYASVEYAPPWNSFDVALHALANINPCGENPSHVAKIRKWAGSKLQQLMKWAIENPEFVSALTAAAVKTIV